MHHDANRKLDPFERSPAVGVIRATVHVEAARRSMERARADLERAENALMKAQNDLVPLIKNGMAGARMVLLDKVLWRVENDGSVTRVEYACEGVAASGEEGAC